MADLSSTVTAKLLETRRSLRGTGWDGPYLDHFVQILCRLESGRHGFTVDDLRIIESAWSSQDEPHWAGGFIARLGDRRRAYVDGFAGQAHWSMDAEVATEFLAAGQVHPDLGSQHGGQFHGWDDRVAEGLNELLRRLPT